MIKKYFLFLILSGSVSMHSFAQQKIRLTDNWEFVKQDPGDIWKVVRPVKPGNPESVPLWDSITLPHCVNIMDAVDPDDHSCTNEWR